MTDIHCHILPSVDDGAENIDISLDMARLASDSGVESIIATPHCNIPGAEYSNFAADALYERFSELQSRIENNGIPIRIYSGAEVLCTDAVPGLLKEGKLFTLAQSDYLLVEFFFDERIEYMNDMLSQLSAEGVVPVIAHPERYEAVQQIPMLVAEWFELGYVIQLNKGSVLGRFGRKPADTASWILNRGIAHIIASDAHSAVSRTTDMDEIKYVLEKRWTFEYANVLLNRNPQQIVHNLPMIPVGEL